ncbi:metallophosphoesterase [Neokomagataea thailandica NBRC 106555]|uniref:DNA repair exonuclease n=2 Tax=Neokomagataea TaxID=1223423 RepID=A0A4Y6V9Y3_9PROT|nr:MULTISPECIES: DNA repair exonuclease [Neokomagataea]QDH25411.1 DNA repair exonuclease [Neokomagataea tanensis]GBR53563.1 metallophosphoesterase [Neokomagataea thailandica NBRC 106555]
MKFIHTADWQLGKPFGRFDAERRSSLTQARFDVIDRIGTLACSNDARHVLVAGDVFDTEGPEERTIAQAVARMERHACCWWLLPGNHDFARNHGLWDRVRKKIKAGSAGTIKLLTEAAPHEIEDGVWLLPAPLQGRHTQNDPTTVFDTMATPNARLRIGLAHGGVTNFGSEYDADVANLIAPNRAQISHLDYLALGDWHGRLKIDARTWYAGTPEVDRFHSGTGRDEPGSVLLVTLGQGQSPQVEPLQSGRYRWVERSWIVDGTEAFEAELKRFLESTEAPETLLRLKLAGMTDLTQRVAITSRLENDIAHRLMFLDVNSHELLGRPADDDFVALEGEGMLGLAAQKLRERIEIGGEEGRLARKALERLFIEFQRVNS